MPGLGPSTTRDSKSNRPFIASFSESSLVSTFLPQHAQVLEMIFIPFSGMKNHERESGGLSQVTQLVRSNAEIPSLVSLTPKSQLSSCWCADSHGQGWRHPGWGERGWL